MAYQDGLKQSQSNLDPVAALRAPVTVLLGVSDQVSHMLGSLGLKTVLDLASSPLFVQAAEIVAAARGEDATIAPLGTVSGGIVVDGGPSDIATLVAADLSVLRALIPAAASDLKQNLQVDTVGDLGRWPPFRAARDILDAATGSAPDSETGSELIPRLGNYPTERRFYATLVMDQVVSANPTDLATAGPLSLEPTLTADFGFSAPAIGARLTFEQTWFAQGFTLGSLLHSLALAPGESTRLAVLDWSRRTAAATSEAISETEQLTNITTHNRAVSEVQDAVAKEAQSGFSHTASTGSTEEGGAGLGLAIGPVVFGAAGGAAQTSTTADSVSSSAGSRTLEASMSQKVMDATQQAASSSRNRRASIVQEVSEDEHASASTRIVANYNHMHALTVQYYEVVELYRVSVALSEAERCLYVPMKLLDFTNQVVQRYQGALAAAALDKHIGDLLTTEFGTIRLTPKAPVRPLIGNVLIALTGLRAAALRIAQPSVSPAAANAASPDSSPPPPAPVPVQSAIFSWNPDELSRASRVMALPVARATTSDLFLAQDSQLVSAMPEAISGGATISGISVKLQSGQTPIGLNQTSIGWMTPSPVPVQEISEIVVSAQGQGLLQGTLSLEFDYLSARFPITIPLSLAAGTTVTACSFGGSEAGPELLAHLNAHKLYYNQVIWRSLDPAMMALLLSQFDFEGMHVANLVDPRPLQVVGNYLVFRMPGFTTRRGITEPVETQPDTPEGKARQAWRAWLQQRGLTFDPRHTTEALVPVATGGVFAEAVLGRSNAAEKLDATRFWNWQDSPIPLQPPEIAAISLESRNQPIDLQPGQLGQPVLNIVNPTSLPDPAGLGAVLGAIQNGNMFRDMSGLAATIGLAQATAADATSAASDAVRQAGANLNIAAQRDIAEKQIAAQVAMSGMGGRPASGGGPKNISEMGSLINAAAARDKDKAAAAARAPGSGGSVGTTAGGSGGGGSGGGSSATSIQPTFAANSGSLADTAFQRAFWGETGAPVADVVSNLAAPGGGTGGSTAPDLSAVIAALTTEVYFYSSVQRIGNLATFQDEIAALAAGTWAPASPDFRAIAIRSNHMKAPPASAEISSLDEFFATLAQPAARFNFFGYFSDTSSGVSLPMNGQVQSGSFASKGDVRGGIDQGSLDTVTIQKLGDFLKPPNIINAMKDNNNLVQALIAINNANRDFAQSVTNEFGEGIRRQLWLYLCINNPPAPAWPVNNPSGIAHALGQLLGMDVFFFPAPITHRPELHDTPVLDEIRGQVSVGTDPTITKDIHTLDGNGTT